MDAPAYPLTGEELPAALPQLGRLRAALTGCPQPREVVESLLLELSALDVGLRERNSRWLALHEVSTRLARELDDDRLLEEIVRSGVALLHGTSGGMTLRDAQTRALTIRLAYSQGAFLPELVGRYLSPHESLAQRVVTTGLPQMVAQYDTWADRVPGFERFFQGAILVVPFFMENRVAGTLSVVNPAASFTEVDVQTLMLLGQQAAASLERTRLRQQAAALALSEERARVARELHDGLAQDLASLLLRADLCQETIPAELPQIRAELDGICQGLQRAIRDARASIFTLRSARGGNLEDDLQAILKRFEEQTGIHTQVCITGSPPHAASRVLQALTNVVQEALRNVQKHAAARHVQVEIVWEPDAAQVVVADDGCGFDVAAELGDYASPLHFGLRTQQELLAAQRGALTVESAAGRGTRLAARLPLGGQRAE